MRERRREREPGALPPALGVEHDAVAVCEEPVAIQVVDLDRNLECGIGRVGGEDVRHELVAVNAHIADRHSHRIALAEQLRCVERPDASLGNPHPHLGLGLVESCCTLGRARPDARAARALEEAAPQRRWRLAPAPALLVVEHRGPQHRLPEAIRGGRAERRWRSARAGEAHPDGERATDPEPAGCFVVTKRLELHDRHALAAKCERVPQRKGGCRPCPVPNRLHRLARRHVVQPVGVGAHDGPLSHREPDALHDLLRAFPAHGRNRIGPGRERDQSGRVGKPGAPRHVEQVQPADHDLPPPFLARGSEVVATDAEPQRHAALVSRHELDRACAGARSQPGGEEERRRQGEPGGRPGREARERSPGPGRGTADQAGGPAYRGQSRSPDDTARNSDDTLAGRGLQRAPAGVRGGRGKHTAACGDDRWGGLTEGR